MTRNWSRWIGLAVTSVAFHFGIYLQPARALDTPNVLMGVDPMVLRAGGIFRDPSSFATANGNDGFNTFQYGTFNVNNSLSTGMGKYDAFRFQVTGPADCCISHNARRNGDSNTPDSVIDNTTDPISVTTITDSVTNAYLPVIDRAVFGQVFTPSEYKLEVKFKPLLTQATANSLGVNPFPKNPTYPPISAPVSPTPTPPAGTMQNVAPLFQVILDQGGGYVWDEGSGKYKRAGEQIGYNIGSAAAGEMPLNQLYATLPLDADGFATYSVPLTEHDFVNRSAGYFLFGDPDFNNDEVVTNGGRTFNAETGEYDDVTIGYGPNFRSFGGGPADPNNPNSKLNTPNGVSLISFGAPNDANGDGVLGDSVGLHIEVKSVAVKKINATPIMARIDENSGIAFRVGSGFFHDFNQPINVNGTPLRPLATNQISRFDGTGMTDLVLNMRTPDAPGAGEDPETHKFLVRNAANGNVFDASQAVVNVRAQLLQPIAGDVADSLRVYARTKKGNDTTAGTGADEWYYDLDLTQFNTTSMTTISVPMSQFTRNMNSSELGPPLGFANFGDGLLTNFALYEFGGQINPNEGLLKLVLDYMEIRLPEQGLIGDYNNDKKVDAADYTVWRDNLGSAGTTLGANRDPANSGVVGPADFNSWKAHFGQIAGSGSLATGAVPEPATLSLLAGMLGLAAWRRRAA